MENRKSEPPDLNKCHFGNVGKAHSALNVCSSDFPMTLSVTCPPSPAFSSITLTPGRIRNIDQDMEALRISRQDNPFLQVNSKDYRLRSILLGIIFVSASDCKSRELSGKPRRV